MTISVAWLWSSLDYPCVQNVGLRMIPYSDFLSSRFSATTTQLRSRLSFCCCLSGVWQSSDAFSHKPEPGSKLLRKSQDTCRSKTVRPTVLSSVRLSSRGLRSTAPSVLSSNRGAYLLAHIAETKTRTRVSTLSAITPLTAAAAYSSSYPYTIRV